MSYTVNRREMLRRTLAGGVGAAVAPWVANLAEAAEDHAAHLHAAAQTAPPAADWTPKALDAHQNDLVVELTELIIPQTETAGAKAALVNRFVDNVLDDADPRDKKEFLRGLAWVDERSKDLFGADFLGLQQRAADGPPHHHVLGQEQVAHGPDRRGVLPVHQVHDHHRLLHLRDRHAPGAGRRRPAVLRRVQGLHAPRTRRPRPASEGQPIKPAKKA